MELKEALKLIDRVKAQIEETRKAILTALFATIANLSSIYLESEQEYDDNNYIMVTRVKRINGLKVPGLSALEYGLEDADRDDADYRSALVEMDLKDEELETIVATLQKLSSLGIEDYRSIKRKNYIK